MNLVSMIMVWVSVSFCYYLMSYQLKYIQGDLYINNLVSSSSEVFAILVSGYFYVTLGLKNVLILSYVIAIAGMVSLIISGTQN